MARIQSTCAYCGGAFLAYPSEVRAGWKKYCCRACGHASLRRTPGDFWARVRRDDGCWEWQGGRNRRGYGCVTIAQRKWLAHRYAWTVTNGAIPLGMQVCHACDNPPCCRPAHLFLGDDAANRADMSAKGRGRTTPQRGATNTRAVLSDDVVRAIRRRYASGGVTQRGLAAEYGVSQRTVVKVILRKAWTHVD